MITAFTVATPDYYRHAEALQASFRAHNPHGRFILHRIEQEFASSEEKIGHSANIRSKLALQYLNFGFNHLLYLDADSIVRGPLDDLECMEDSYDLFAYPRPWMQEEQYKFLISTIYFRDTERTKAFIEAWIRETYSRPLNLMTVQPAFYAVSLLNLAKVGALPLSYTDWDMRGDSLIWCGKGPRKDSHPAYLQELAKYVGPLQVL